MPGFDYTLLKKPEAYSDSKGTIVGRPLYPSEVHGNLIALADAINSMLGPLTQAQFGSRVDSVKMWVPVNFVYIQFPGMSLPSNLMMGTWSNISSNFAGDFFRAEGGSFAKPFEGGEQTCSNLTHVHGANCDQDTPDHTHPVNESLGDGVVGATVASGTGSFNTGGASTRHTHAIGIVASGGNEARPINVTIRVWKRTA